MKSIKILVLILTFIVLSLASKAQLYFKNSSSSPVNVAYAMQSNAKGDESWSSYGWYSVDPYQTKSISSAVGLNPNVYWYAESQDGKYVWNGENRDGSVSFLVSSDAFSIKNASLEYVKDKNPGYTWKSFRQIKIGILKTKYTIEISD